MNKFIFKLPKRKKFIFLSSKQFKIIRQIGSGGFARVYLVKCLIDNQLYAMKKIEFSRISNWDQENVQKEIKIHKKLNSQYVVKMIDYFQEDRIVYIILEYCEKGDLYEFIRKRSRMPSDMILSFFKDICQGIKYLHDNKIIMRDLKPENCLITKDERIKICDFGWACKYNDEEHYLKLQAGSLPYMAPESLRGDAASNKTDIWSLGIMLYELFFNKEPFLANSPETQLILIENSVLDFNPGFIIESAKDLIEQTLQLNEIDRPCIEDILESEYLNDKKQNYYSGIKLKTSRKQSIKQHTPNKQQQVTHKQSSKKKIRDHSTPIVKRYVIEHSASQKPRKKSSQNQRKQIITNDIQKLAQEKLIDDQEKQISKDNQQKYYQIKKKIITNQDNNQYLNHRSKSVTKVLFQNFDNKQINNKNNQIQNNIENNFRQKINNTIQQKEQNENQNNQYQQPKQQQYITNKIQNYQKQKSLILENPHQNKIKLKKARTSYVGFQKYSKSQNINQTRRQSRIRIEDLSREKRIADQVVQLLQNDSHQIQQKFPKFSVPYQKSLQHPVLQDIYQKKQLYNKNLSQNQFIIQNQTSDRQIKLYNEKKNKIKSKRIKNDQILGYKQIMLNRNNHKNKLMALPVIETKQPKYKKKEKIKNIYYHQQQIIKSKSVQPKKQNTMFKDFNFNKNINNIFNISGR